MASGTEGFTVVRHEAGGQSTAESGGAARALSPVELPAPAADLADGAASRLGWYGTAVPETTLLGRRVIVYARLRTEAHAERICLGVPPVTDRAEVSTWVWPEFEHIAPPAAVEIVGVLAVARHWRTALASAAPFTNYCDTGIVLPWSAAMTADYLYKCLPRAQRYNVSVLTGDPDGAVSLDQSGGRDPFSCGGLPAIERWLNEKVYEQILAQ